MTRAACLAIPLIFVGMFVTYLDAQVRYGSIVVEARDQSGSAVPGADDVTITETGTNLSRTGVTNTRASSRSRRSRRAPIRSASTSPASRSSSHGRGGLGRHRDARRQPARSGTAHRHGSRSPRARRSCRPTAPKCAPTSRRCSSRTCRCRSAATIRTCSSPSPASRRPRTCTRWRSTRRAAWRSARTARRATRTRSASRGRSRTTSGCRTSPPTSRRSRPSNRSA